MYRFILALFSFLLVVGTTYSQPAYLESYFQALCGLKEKRFGEAKDFIIQSNINGLPELEEFLFLCNLNLEKGLLVEAEANYLKADALKPGVGAFGLAKVFSLTGRDSIACSWLLLSLGSAYKLPQSVYLRDNALQRLDGSLHWKNLWNGDYYSKNEQFEADLDYLLSKKNYNEALDLLNEKGEKHRLRHQQQAILARIYYLQQSYSSAVDNYSLAIKRAPQNPDYLNGRAKAYLMLGKYGRALDDIQKAIESNPLNPEFYFVKAKANAGFGNAEQSRTDFALFLKANGENPQAIYEYVKLLQQGGFYLEALRQINRCILLKADVADYYLERAAIYMKTNGYKYAVDDYAMVLDLEPPKAEIYLQKGYARAAMGDSNGACVDWKKAASMGSLDAQSMVARNCH